MQRPHLTIKLKTGIAYDAMSFMLNMDGTVAFVSSGRMEIRKYSEVEAVEYHETGATWCPWCDQSIQGFSKA